MFLHSTGMFLHSIHTKKKKKNKSCYLSLAVFLNQELAWLNMLSKRCASAASKNAKLANGGK